MANRRPDYILLAAMQLNGFLPEPVAEAIIGLYDGPPPMSYESALNAVRTKTVEVIASGALEGVAAMPEPPRLPVPQGPRVIAEDDDDHDPELCHDCDFERHHPPRWYVDAYFMWNMMNEDD